MPVPPPAGQWTASGFPASGASAGHAACSQPPRDPRGWPSHAPYQAPLASNRHAPQGTDKKAVVSLVLGLVSMACVGIFAGLPAIILGATARRDIDRSNGRLTGGHLAATGIVTGLFGTGIGFVVLLWVMGAQFAPSQEATADGARTAQSAAARPAAAAAPGTRSYGSLEVVDLDDSRPLRAQLAEVIARSHGKTVVLQTFISSSAACTAVADALPDSRMQRALANVVLVRVDVEEYERELAKMRVETRTAPWFYKLDAKADPTDSISADAWDANVPENMAPVLGRFVHKSARRSSR